MCNVDIHNSYCKNISFTRHVLQEISSACVDIKSKGIEESCIISGDRGRPHVYVFTNTLTMELNQKLTKTCPDLGDAMGQRGGGRLLKGSIFSRATVPCYASSL